jgi:hypothetical protein
MRWEILGTLILAVGASIAWADELPRDTNLIQTLTVEQAEELVRKAAEGQALSLNGLNTLPPEVAAILATHKGAILLNGIEEMSADAERALEKHRGVLQCRGLRTLKSAALAEKLSIPMHTPLESFLWGINGWNGRWEAPLLLSCLVVMLGCIAYLLWLATKLAKAETLTTELRQEYTRSAIPFRIAAVLWCFVAIDLGVWSHTIYFEQMWLRIGRSRALAMCAPLDWLMLVTGLTLIDLAGNLPWALQRRLRNTRPLWGMTPYFPASLTRTAVLITAYSLACLASGAAVLHVVNYVHDTIVDGRFERHPLFLYHFAELWFVFPLMLAAVTLMVHFLSIRSRRDRSFDAYSDHFAGAMSQMLPSSNSKNVFGFGEGYFPWSAVESFSWKPDHLELHVRPGRPHNRISEKWLVSGVVPPEQRQTAHEFLSARMPGEGEPTGDSVNDQTAPDESPS